MAPWRSSYRRRLENPDAIETVTPVVAAKLAPVAADAPKPAEMAEAEKDPVKEAAQNAIKQRLLETEHAHEIAREVVHQHPQFATEPQQPLTVDEIVAGSGLPERVQSWLRQHPDCITDADQNARMQKMHHVAEYQSGEAFNDAYFERMEVLLGFKPDRQQSTVTAPRKPALQQRSAPVSAPPHRDVPSMSTGRPQHTSKQLSPQELADARTFGITPQAYREGKERRDREIAAGLHERG